MAKLYFYYSAMNAGKSTMLLQSDYNYQERGMKTMIFTSSLDDRSGYATIASRIGINKKAQVFTNSTALYQVIAQQHSLTPIDCVLLDEAQFLTKEQVLDLCKVVDNLNIPVLAYGIRTDFQGNFFSGSQYLMAWADNLVELKTICSCGRKANFIIRRDEQGNILTSGSQVMIGDAQYQSVCRKHHFLTSMK